MPVRRARAAAGAPPVSMYLLPELPKKRPYSWIFTADPNKRHGALLTAIDHEANRYYMAEHYAENLPDSQHAEAFKAILATFHLTPGRDVELWADPGGAGAQAIINMRELGLPFQAVKKDAGSVKASIELIRRAAWIDPNHRHPLTGVKGAPHCWFLTSLRSAWTEAGVVYAESRLMHELRQYRQKEHAPPDTPVKTKDDICDCLRYVEMVRPFAPPRGPDPEREEKRAKLDATSRQANDEFEELVQTFGRGKAAATEKGWTDV